MKDTVRTRIGSPLSACRPFYLLRHFSVFLVLVTSGGTVLVGEPERKWPEEYAEALPIQRITFPGGFKPPRAAFSSDGERLFVQVDNFAVNVWEVFVYYWPEVLGGLLGLTVLVCVLCLRRVSRTKRIPGEPHCRNCNYCLKYLESDRCPECGRIARRPVIGRPQWVRVSPWIAVLVVASILYSGLWVLGAPRSNRASNWLEWWSPSLLSWAKERHFTWLSARANFVGQVAEYDVKSGEQRGILFTRRMPLPPGVREGVFTLTPEGQGLILSIERDDALVVVNTRTGRIKKKMTCLEIARGTRTRWRGVAGFDDDGRTVYVTALDEYEKKTKLVAWNWTKGRHEVLLETTAYSHWFWTGRDRVVSRDFLRLPDGGNLKFLEISSLTEIGSGTALLMVRDARNPEAESVTITTTLAPFVEPVISSDAQRVMVASRASGGRLIEFDLTTGKRVNEIRPPPLCWLSGFYRVDWSGRRLIAEAAWIPSPPRGFAALRRSRFHAEVFLVRDLTTEKWLGWFARPENWIDVGLIVSPDGRYFAACGIGGRTPRGVPEVLIYDLTSLPHDVEYGTPEEIAQWEADEAKALEREERRRRQRRADR
jgi:hypothetical protein